MSFSITKSLSMREQGVGCDNVEKVEAANHAQSGRPLVFQGTERCYYQKLAHAIQFNHAIQYSISKAMPTGCKTMI